MRLGAGAVAAKIDATRTFFDKPRRAAAMVSPLQAHTFEEIARRIPVGTADATAVDLGCHWGSYTRVIAQTYGRVIGIDFADHALATAELADNIAYVRIDLNAHVEALASLGPVDLFCAIALMEMLVDPASLCRTMASVLNPGGRVVAFIPNRRSINFVALRSVLWAARIVTRRRDRYIYNNGLTIDGLRGHLEAAGLAIEKIESISGIPVYLAQRLPHLWQRALLALEPSLRALLGGSYHAITCSKPLDWHGRRDHH